MAMASSFSPSSSYLCPRNHNHHLTHSAPFSLCPSPILFKLSQTLSSPNKFAATSIRCSSNNEASSTPTTARKLGVSVYKPKSYEVLVTDAANSLACALDDGKTRLEIDFPPLPTSVSSYKGSSDDFSDANVQLALAVIRKLQEKRETQACLVFPDNPEKRRSSELFKSAIDLIDGITIASLDDIPTGPVASFFRSVRNTLDFDFDDENEGRWQNDKPPSLFIFTGCSTRELATIETYLVSYESQFSQVLNIELDQIIEMSGDVPAVLKALMEIGSQLRDNPPKQIISINPTYNLGFVHRPTQQFVDPSSAEYVTLEMMISETFIGGLIGRCGSNISRIRTESGATIKVHGGKGENKHRQIHLGGSAQQVAMAKQRVDEYIYAQMMQETGGQQSMVDDTSALMAGPMYYPPVPPQAYYGLPNPYAPHL